MGLILWVTIGQVIGASLAALFTYLVWGRG